MSFFRNVFLTRIWLLYYWIQYFSLYYLCYYWRSFMLNALYHWYLEIMFPTVDFRSFKNSSTEKHEENFLYIRNKSLSLYLKLLISVLQYFYFSFIHLNEFYYMSYFYEPNTFEKNKKHFCLIKYNLKYKTDKIYYMRTQNK